MSHFARFRKIEQAQDRAVAVFGRLPGFEQQARIINCQEAGGFAVERP